MQALQGTLGERANAAFAAGCDVALHCNGQMAEMVDIAGFAPKLAGRARRRADAALTRLRHLPEPLDAGEARARLDAALASLRAA
jgi:beta-N-acetylhexosaminidase